MIDEKYVNRTAQPKIERIVFTQPQTILFASDYLSLRSHSVLKGRYEIVSRLGKGCFGIVLLALDLKESMK